MTTEFLNVVDENDQVIDTQTRKTIHQNKLRHRAVHILVFNQQRQLFLQKRSMLKDINKGLWDTSAAGHVDVGEDYNTCAIRESEEELGINIEPSLQLLFKLPANEITGMEFIQVFQSHHNGPFRLNANEIDEGKWFSINKTTLSVKENNSTLTETFKTIWRQYLINFDRFQKSLLIDYLK